MESTAKTVVKDEANATASTWSDQTINIIKCIGCNIAMYVVVRLVVVVVVIVNLQVKILQGTAHKTGYGQTNGQTYGLSKPHAV